MNNCCVYWIHLPTHSNIMSEGYVGVSKSFNTRMTIHKNSTEHPILRNAIDKYGWDNLIKEKILISTEKYCYAIENKLRSFEKIGWNIAIGGDKPCGMIGRKHKDESKSKMSLSHTNRPRAKHTQESKDKISKSRIGKYYKNTNPNFRGYVEATNIKTRNTILMIGKQEIKDNGFDPSSVYGCISNKLKTHKGYIFKRIKLEVES